MKELSLQQLERDFDRIVDDVVENGEHYVITLTSCSVEGCLEKNAVVIIPAEDYDVLLETYEDWVTENSTDIE